MSNATIYLDTSQSMRGFVAPAKKGQDARFAAEPHLFPDLVFGLPQALSRAGIQTSSIKKFGGRIEEMPIFEEAVRPSTYRETASAIGAVFSATAKKPANEISIVITDLFLSYGQAVGTNQASLTGPLADILQSGRSIGLLGVRSRFTEPVVDLPGGSRDPGYTVARPVYVLIIGPDPAIAAIHDSLVASYLQALPKESWHFTLFSPRMAPQPPLPPITGQWTPARSRPAQVPPINGVSAVVAPLGAEAGTATWTAPLPRESLFPPDRIRLTTAVGLSLHATDSTLERGEGCTWRPLRTDGPPPHYDGKTLSLPFDRNRFAIRQFYHLHGVVTGIAVDDSSPALAWMKEGDVNPATGTWRGWSFTATTEPALIATRPTFFPTANLHGFSLTLAQIAFREFKKTKTPLAGFDIVFRLGD